MDIIHADASRRDLRFIQWVEQFDAQVSIRSDAALADNSFSLQIPDDEWQREPVLIGHLIFVPYTEFGGIVEKVEHSTSTGIVTLSGVTWRGMLMRKVIEPPTGQAYYDVTGEANSVLSNIIGAQLSDMAQVSAVSTGKNISGHWRYVQMHTALERALENAGLTLDISYNPVSAKIIINARTVTDHSADIDLSQDYGLAMKSSQGRIDAYNHIIALGAGELLDRDIAHVYMLSNGTTTTTAPSWVGTVDDKTAIYDYSNPETADALIQGAIKRIQEYAPQDGVELDPSGADLDLPMGDIVGARDRLTGLEVTAKITGKILTINQEGIRTDTKVG